MTARQPPVSTGQGRGGSHTRRQMARRKPPACELAEWLGRTRAPAKQGGGLSPRGLPAQGAITTRLTSLTVQLLPDWLVLKYSV